MYMHFSSQIAVTQYISNSFLVNLLVHSWFTRLRKFPYNSLKTGVIAPVVSLGPLVHSVHRNSLLQTCELQ